MTHVSNTEECSDPAKETLDDLATQIAGLSIRRSDLAILSAEIGALMRDVERLRQLPLNDIEPAVAFHPLGHRE